ncbi:MAG: hypothetical protein CM1200mP29_10530 [Verrucomicrobiota bacterium]|nr:MAG: hypothetical protein CM1200mP29_10530 [Verrucomicrobiota bacterium]
MSPQTCKVCQGQRLREVVLAVTLSSANQPGGEHRFGAYRSWMFASVHDEALHFFEALELDELEKNSH